MMKTKNQKLRVFQIKAVLRDQELRKVEILIPRQERRKAIMRRMKNQSKR